MQAELPNVLSIAGFDPSAGAGILADIKTFESQGAYGLGVCSAITFQNDISFEKVHWVSADDIIEQVKVLRRRFDFRWVKIGLIESLHVLEELTRYIKEEDEAINIIWDPILKASAGFEFHNGIDRDQLEKISRRLFLITPNHPEALHLISSGTPEESSRQLSAFCNVLLKGGHDHGKNANDLLFTGNEAILFSHERMMNVSKHGSGCVLSSAITANLAKGMSLLAACDLAKKYITGFLKSSDTLLGSHYKIRIEG